MKTLIEREEEYVQSILQELNIPVTEVTLNVSSRPELGDYQYNGAMQLAKVLGKNPREIATLIVDRIKKDNHFKDISIAGPGFINITLKDEVLVDYLNELKDNIELNYHNESPKKIFMDYGGANVAKALHVGHLRSANIGEALKRLLQAFHNEVLADAHLGDWGRPIGLVMTAIKHEHPELPYFDPNFKGEYPKESPVTNDDLMRLYPLASAKAKEDESYMEEARSLTVAFQKGDKGLLELWNQIMKVSKEDIKKTYDRMHTTFEVWEGESDCDKYIPELISILEKENLLKDSQGAKVIYVNEENDDHEVPPVLIEKSNGSASYETTDMAGILERVTRWNPDEIWYLTDIRQSLHFEQVFRASRLAKIVPESTKLEFIPFGTMNGSDGKPFKTRDGGVMKLEDLLNIVVNECEHKIMENITGEERQLIAEQVGIAAVKYADLIPYRSKDYNFDPVKFSDLQGKTGPYLLYSTIRMESLLKKAKEQGIRIEKYHKITKDVERKAILQLVNLRGILENALQTKSLNDITEYLYDMSNTFNNLYASVRVLTEEDALVQESWLVLTKVIDENNKKLLNILGIELPNRM